jgi:hypothetical protein
MMRDDLDLSQTRSSRIPRVVAIVSTLGILLIAVWVFAPILMAKYAAATATRAAGPKPDTVAQQVPGPATAAAADQAATPAPATTAVAAGADDNAQPPAPAAAPGGADNNLAASPWPKDPPQVWPQPQDQAAAPPPPVQAAAPPPAPPASANTMQLASIAPADTNTSLATTANAAMPANVPLPRSRPSKLIAARLAIPLPRPRPADIDGPNDTPTPQMRAFDLQVERMR